MAASTPRKSSIREVKAAADGDSLSSASGANIDAKAEVAENILSLAKDSAEIARDATNAMLEAGIEYRKELMELNNRWSSMAETAFNLSSHALGQAKGYDDGPMREGTDMLMAEIEQVQAANARLAERLVQSSLKTMEALSALPSRLFGVMPKE